MLENEFDKMLNDLDAANDEFVNSYFEEEVDGDFKESFLKEIDSDIEEECTDNSDIEFAFNSEESENYDESEETETVEKEESINKESNKSEIEFEMKSDEEIESSSEKYDETVGNPELDEVDASIASAYQEEINEVPQDDIQNEEHFDLEKNNEEQIEQQEENSEENIQNFEENQIENNDIRNTEINEVEVKVNDEEITEVEEPQVKKRFSYNEILDRLDREKTMDLSNVVDIMKLLDKCDNADDFFERVENNGKQKLG